MRRINVSDGKIRMSVRHCATATDAQMRRLGKVVVQLREWRDALRVHPDTDVEVRFDDPPDEGEQPGLRVLRAKESAAWLMLLQTDRGAYGRYRLWASARCLEPRRDDVRIMDVIHEMLHIRLFDYSRVAEGLAGEQAPLLASHEETVISHLERAIARLVGIEEHIA